MIPTTRPGVRRRLLLLGTTLLLLLTRPLVAAETPEEWSIGKPRTGDFDMMQEHRQIRALVVFNKMTYFLDGGRQRGSAYELLSEFEKFVNRRLKTKTLKVRVVFIPVPRDQLIPALLDGRGDIAAANLTITPARRELVDFSQPLLSGVDEILVTGPAAEPIETLEQLSGRTLHLRPSSSYYEHLQALNRRFIAAGRAPVELRAASELHEDADLLEMVNAGLLPMAIVDSHKAEFWADVFENLTLHPEIAVNRGGQIGWAFRQQSPQLAALVNEFVADHKKGTLLGNILYKRYLKSNQWARNALDKEEVDKLNQVVALFKKYADRYGFNYLMVGALAYQESQLDHDKRSHVGAVGIMQVLPSTAADKNVGIPDIEELEPNIHAGIKYLRFLHDRYFDDPAIDPFDQALFTFAAYNAGPAKVARLRSEAGQAGLDPNRWFRNVEVIAAKRIGRETVQYVSNIFKYFTAYRLIEERLNAAGRSLLDRLSDEAADKPAAPPT